MKSPKTPESASCPLLVAVVTVVVVVVADVCLDSSRSWTLDDFVTAVELDCRCEENVSLTVDVAMSREAWKHSRL
jgi:hypothetical protein